MVDINNLWKIAIRLGNFPQRTDLCSPPTPARRPQKRDVTMAQITLCYFVLLCVYALGSASVRVLVCLPSSQFVCLWVRCRCHFMKEIFCPSGFFFPNAGTVILQDSPRAAESKPFISTFTDSYQDDQKTM